MSWHTEVVLWKLQGVQRNMTPVPLCYEDDTQTKKYSIKVKKSNKRCYCMIYGCQMAEGNWTLNPKVRQKVSLTWASKNGRTQLCRREERTHRAMAERRSVFPIFLPASFPFFSFPKVEKYQKGFENENYGLEMCLLKYYKRNNLFFHLFHHSYNKPWIIKYV